MVAWKRARKVNKRAREKFLEPKRRPLFSRLFSGYHSAIIHAVLVASAESAVPRFSEKAFCEIVLLAVFFALFQWKVVNSLFDSGQDYICDDASTQVNSAVEKNKAKCCVLFLLELGILSTFQRGRHKFQLSRKQTWPPFQRADNFIQWIDRYPVDKM